MAKTRKKDILKILTGIAESPKLSGAVRLQAAQWILELTGYSKQAGVEPKPTRKKRVPKEVAKLLGNG